MAEKVKKVNQTITGLELKYEVLLVYLLSFLGFIFAFMKDEKVSESARFHYKQSGATFAVYLGVSIVDSILATICVSLAFTPLFGISIMLGIVSGLLSLVNLAVLIFAIITIIKAFNGERYEIPVVIKIANAIWKK